LSNNPTGFGKEAAGLAADVVRVPIPQFGLGTIISLVIALKERGAPSLIKRI